MAATLERNQPLDEACRLVGRFLKHYAIMEQALDLAIGKHFGFLAAIPETGRQRFLNKTKSGIMTLNNDRVIVAHCPFDQSPDGGVSFRRVVTEGQLKIINVTRSLDEIESKCTLAVELAEDLNRVVAEMKPYEPSLDFSDSRNAVYIAALGA